MSLVECLSDAPASLPLVETTTFLGITIHLITPQRLLEVVTDSIGARQKIVVANHNLHSLCLHGGSGSDAAALRRFYEKTHYTLADGMSIVLLGGLFRKKLSAQHRIAYNDWLPVMLPVAVAQGWRVFYLGSTEAAAARGVDVLRSRFPGLQLEVHHGHFDAQPGSAANAQVVEEIRAYRPHLLFVGMGMPRQESWILENLDALEANVILPSGATLDYIAGTKKMAPRWMGRLGLEWAFRLATEPRRLAFRYLVEPWALVGTVMASTWENSRAVYRTRGSGKTST